MVATLGATSAYAAAKAGPVARAQVIGVTGPLKADLLRAIGEERGPPSNRIDARRRARVAVDNATALLRSEGYYDATVEPDISATDKPQPLVKIELGPRTVFGDTVVSYTGAAPDSLAVAAAEKAIALKPGAPARAADVLAAQGRVVAALQARGYADAKSDTLTPVVDHATKTMLATFKVEAGALVRMDGIRFETKGHTDPRFVKPLVPWKPGDVYKPSDIAELQRRLTDTGVYDAVTVALSPTPDASGNRPVVVSVADRTKHSFSFSAGYSTTEGPDLDTTYSIYNVFNRADTLTYLARAQTIDSRIGVTLSFPDFWSPSQTLSVGPDIFRDVTNAYTSTGAEFVANLTQKYGKTSFFTRGISLVASRVDDKELGSIDFLALRPLGEFSWDHTDNPLDSHHGWKAEVKAEPIATFGDKTDPTRIVSDSAQFYLKLQTQESVYFPIRPDTTFAARLHVGAIVGGQIPEVPASDRFFAGGGGSVRGYEYQNVGPHYADNTPQGGLSVVETSFELRRDNLWNNVGAVLFLDSGVVGAQETPSFTHIASSVGIGARYDLGFAPLRADFAFPINKLSAASQSPVQVYLSIGQAF
ncbi:MAG: autotransporter assembly complex protein TamA [Caulobacteraceae bacterium]